MKKKWTLRNKKFIYNDGNHYQFSIMQPFHDSNSNSIDGLIYITKRHSLTFKIYKWRKTFYYYLRVCKPVNISYYKTDTPSDMRFRIINEITNTLRKVKASKVKKIEHVEMAFSEFDGYIDVPNSKRLEIERTLTIESIIE